MKVLLSLSGGVDSTTLLYDLANQGHEVHTVFFDYGSKHNEYERKALQNIIRDPKVSSFETIDATSIFTGLESSLLKTGEDIPEGHYSSESMKSTVVPARNLIFISILTAMAISKKADIVALAIHAGDHAIYPDCRPMFFEYMRDVVEQVSEGDVSIWAPFLSWTKQQIVKHGIKLNVPYHLTRTCYKDQSLSCGKCGSCVERLEAFQLNEASDPVEYEKELL